MVGLFFRACILIGAIGFPSVSHAQYYERNIHIGGNVYHPTVSRWLDALSKYAQINSTTYIFRYAGGKDKLHRAGHRDAMVWIPSSTDLAKDLTVVLWFHGHYGYIQHRTFEDRILKQFTPHAIAGKNFIVVLPEMPWSINTRTPKNRNGQLWQKPGQFIDFIFQIENILVRHKIKTAVEGLKDISWVTGFAEIDYRVVGHSAGGSTIATVASTGDLCKIGVSKVVWSDSSYGTWLKKAWHGCLGTANIPTEVFVRKGGAPWRRARQFLKQFKKSPLMLHLHTKIHPWSHKKIGNNIVELSGILE